jgi:hypothetical protein
MGATEEIGQITIRLNRKKAQKKYNVPSKGPFIPKTTPPQQVR